MNDTQDLQIVLQKRQLRQLKLQTFFLFLALALIVAVGLYVAVQFKSVRECIDAVNTEIQELDMSKFNDAAASFSAAADQFAKLDMDKFNDTVGSLQSAAEIFSSVDVEKLNALVQSLETVSSKLQGAVSAITGIFGR